MKVSLAIAQWLRDKGINHVFTISGGACLHIIHSISETDGIENVCPQHEGSAGMAADAYARIRGVGCALATSGPGATNLITAIASSYYDSIPILYITGQVTRDRLSNGSVRQKGFQETPIIDMVRDITNYCEEPKQPGFVFMALETAFYEMNYGRKGPAVISICDDLQRAEC